MKYLSILFGLCLLVLSGCESGGNGTDGEVNDETVGSTSLRAITGSVNTEASTETPIRLSALSYDTNDLLVDSISTALVSSSNTNDAFFYVDLKLADAGGSVVFTAEKEGFTSFSRAIQFDSPTDLEIQGRMQEVFTSTAFVSDTSFTVRNGQSRNSFTFALVEDRFGRRQLLAGGDKIRQSRLAADSTDLLVIDIPASSVSEDTTSLTAKLASFDPNDAEDAEMFPGEYADSDGNELVSVAFDFAEIETQSGESLGRAFSRSFNTRLARNAAEPTIISRFIPQDSCSALESLGDADASVAGFQIPVFTYNPNTGLWDRLGEGTVYTDAGELVGETTTDFECQSNGYYLDVAVSNENFLSSWWNLDYPLTFSEPVNLCAAVKLENQEGDSISGSYVWMSDDDGRSFSDTYGYSDANGRVDLATTLIDGSTDRTAMIRYWDFITGDYSEAPVTLTNDCSTVQTITLVRPDTCEISGSVSDGTGPTSNVDVYAYGYDLSNFFFHNSFATTDAAGNYSMSVVCNTEYTLYNFSPSNFSILNFNVNSEVSENELTDTGDAVTLEPLVIINQAPLGYAYLDFYALEFTLEDIDGISTPVYSLEAGESASLWAWAYDLESDYPISVEINFYQLDGTLVSSLSTTLDSDDDLLWDEDNEQAVTAPSTGSYYLSGTLTDSKGNAGPLYGEFVLE